MQRVSEKPNQGAVDISVDERNERVDEGDWRAYASSWQARVLAP